MKAKLGGRTWAALLTFGLVGQIAWVIENMYCNVFLYNTISGYTSMIAAMVARSAVTATVTTLVMGALSDRLGRRKAFIVAGYLLWGVSIGACALIKSSPVAAAAHSAAVLVVVLFGLLIWRGFRIASRAPDKFTSLAAYGLIAKVALQTVLNIAVVTNSMPNTGISLPFFSSGGTSLILQIFEMGIVLNISRYSYQKRV